MKRFLTAIFVVAVGAAAALQAGIGLRSKCDNEQSRLCDGLVAVYEFEEGLSSGSTPTYPDAVRRNSFGAGDLYEPPAVDVGAGSTQTGVNNGKLGVSFTGYTQPTDVSGLTLWLKADAITGLNDGDAVSSWAPTSGGGTFTNTTTLRPIYKVGIVNGKPVVRLDGVDDYFIGNTAISSYIANNAYTVFLVAKGTSASGTILGESNAPTDWKVSATATTLEAVNHDGASDTASKTGSVTNFFIGTTTHDSGNLKAGVNDTRTASLASVASGNTSSVADLIRVGCTSSCASSYASDIAEIIIYNAALSEANRQKIESYLANKYAISIPYSHVGNGTGADADAAEFNGTTHYLHTGLDGHGGGALGNSPWTVASWAYVNATGSNGTDQVIWSESGRENGMNRIGTEIEFNYNGTILIPRARVYDALSETATTASWTSNVTTGAWHLVVVTFRPRTIFTNGELGISVDGGAKVTAAISGNGGVATGSGTIIGRRADPSDPDFFGGRLDQLTISGIAWTAADITAFYNGGAGREYPFVGN